MFFVFAKLFIGSKNVTSSISPQGSPSISTTNKDRTTLVYFTGIGCPHCAVTDKILFQNALAKDNLLIIEYELYKTQGNAGLLTKYSKSYKNKIGIPQAVFGTSSDKILGGKERIKNHLNEVISSNKGNPVIFPGKINTFEDMNLADLIGMPKIWYKNRAAVRTYKDSQNSESVKTFILKGELPPSVEDSGSIEIKHSGFAMTFAKSYKTDGWLFLVNP